MEIRIGWKNIFYDKMDFVILYKYYNTTYLQYMDQGTRMSENRFPLILS